MKHILSAFAFVVMILPNSYGYRTTVINDSSYPVLEGVLNLFGVGYVGDSLRSFNKLIPQGGSYKLAEAKDILKDLPFCLEGEIPEERSDDSGLEISVILELKKEGVMVPVTATLKLTGDDVRGRCEDGDEDMSEDDELVCALEPAGDLNITVSEDARLNIALVPSE